MGKQGFYDCESWMGLSEQHILDCGSYSAHGENATVKTWYEFHGCNGGMQSNVYQWVYKNRGILAENGNGYNSGDASFYNNKMNIGECGEQDSADFVAVPDKKICGTLNRFGVADPEEMKAAIYDIGPMAVSMFVGDQAFRHYKSGVYGTEEAKLDCPDLKNLNHALAVVGYGFDEESGKDYWIIKNSWSASYGDNGYIKVEMGHNVCGVENDIMYVDMVNNEERVIPVTETKPDAPTRPDEPSTAETTTEEPTTQEPTTEEATTSEPTTQEPTTPEPTTQEPTTEEPTTDNPNTEEPSTTTTSSDLVFSFSVLTLFITNLFQ